METFKEKQNLIMQTTHKYVYLILLFPAIAIPRHLATRFRIRLRLSCSVLSQHVRPHGVPVAESFSADVATVGHLVRV